ncbi:MAG: ATP-binding cassette domain-containing protein [Chloroflexi bacterium]|nr:ATP-binding cassette domain-containing protein [Chloroflexota bacterium]
MDVDLRQISKTFGAVHANVDINLSIPAGTIQGILGENGAGKSTLMKVLSGFIRADQGEILLDGRPVVIHSPADAIRFGVGMLHQDPLDFPPMKALDNFLVGQPGGVLPNRRKAVADLHELGSQFGFNIDPEAFVDSLTVGERQQLEIMRLLWLGARVFIFDEPTTGISALQKEILFATLKQLAEQGKTVIFVSHKLEDVEALCHQVAVLRQGYLVGEARRPYRVKKLVELMFGKEISVGERAPMRCDDVALSISSLDVEDYRLQVRNVDLEICAGEVIGLAGMEGSGQDLFLRACSGLVKPTGGKVILKNRNLTGKSYHVFKKNGVAFLPAARLEEGLASGMSLTEHFVLAEGSKQFFINWEKGRQLAQERITDFNIRGEPGSPVESLSGGNQQRALLALMRVPLSLLLLEHPTRGLDIESTIYIWSKLKARCKQEGTCIIFISSDLEEILQYSDRVLVFFTGKASPPMESWKLTRDMLGQLIGGKGWEYFKTGQGRSNA